MFLWNNDPYFYSVFNPIFTPTDDRPPTLYFIMNSMVNYGKPERVKISELARNARNQIFDFDYPLSTAIKKEDFECMILNNFINRRIGYETFNIFKIKLSVKLNEIMPMYNKLFDSLEEYKIFDSDTFTVDETATKESNQDSNSSNELINNSESDSRNSDTPQNQIQDVKDGSYVSDYSFNQDKSTTNGKANSNLKTTDKNILHREEKRTVADKIEAIKKYQENIKSIYGLIFNDLDILFYQILD